MKNADIEKVRDLLWKLDDKRKLRELIRNTGAIHVTINRGYRDDEHMHFGESEARNQHDIELIRAHLVTVVEADILIFEAELIKLGVELED